jgi:hypothetical protein
MEAHVSHTRKAAYDSGGGTDVADSFAGARH